MSREISVPAAAEEILIQETEENKAKRAKKTPLQLVPAAPLPQRHRVGEGPPRTADRAAGAAEGRVEEDQDQDPRDHRVGRR